MLTIVQFSYDEFRKEHELKIRKQISRCDLPFMRQKAYMDAVEDVFDEFYLELKYNIRSKGKNKSNISELDFEKFYKEAKITFAKKAKEYAEPLEQKSYINGAVKAIAAIRLLLIMLYSQKDEVQSNVHKPVPSLCIVWK